MEGASRPPRRAGGLPGGHRRSACGGRPARHRLPLLPRARSRRLRRGVDVFFVISGFLIASIIRRELERGSFSLVDFWERRARRIVPAVAVVCLADDRARARVLPAGRPSGLRAVARGADLPVLEPPVPAGGGVLRRALGAQAAPAHLVAVDRGAVLRVAAAPAPAALAGRAAAGTRAAARRAGHGGIVRAGRLVDGLTSACPPSTSCPRAPGSSVWASVSPGCPRSAGACRRRFTTRWDSVGSR